MEINAILFDKDGTLFDFDATWSAAMVDLLDEVAPGDLRVPVAKALGVDAVSGRFEASSVVIAGTSAETGEVLAKATGRPLSDVLAAFRSIGHNTRQIEVPELFATLEVLAGLAPLGVVTNDAEASARHHLATSNIARFFGAVIGADSGFGAKPAPGPLIAGAEALGVAPATCLMVGDSLHDLKAGQAAGMVPIGVLTGIATYDDLAPFAEAVLPDIRGVAAWIEKRKPRGTISKG
ncbi:HAD family hydrolase [Rhodobacteraceae bacterium]|nr:HAD family hydrolase [Paracoccaceae bacterium]